MVTNRILKTLLKENSFRRWFDFAHHKNLNEGFECYFYAPADIPWINKK
jgi:hypothetical protein